LSHDRQDDQDIFIYDSGPVGPVWLDRKHMSHWRLSRVMHVSEHEAQHVSTRDVNCRSQFEQMSEILRENAKKKSKKDLTQKKLYTAIGSDDSN
jgi:hypothetical protein